MRTMTALSTITALALSLAACSAVAPADTGKTPDTQPATSGTPAQSEGPSEFGEAVKNSRGNLVKAIGQLAGTSSLTSNVVTSRFAVTDLVLDPTCDSGFSETPANGHYLGIHLNVESTPELAEEEFPWVSFTQYDWQGIRRRRQAAERSRRQRVDVPRFVAAAPRADRTWAECLGVDRSRCRLADRRSRPGHGRQPRRVGMGVLMCVEANPNDGPRDRAAIGPRTSGISTRSGRVGESQQVLLGGSQCEVDDRGDGATPPPCHS